MTSPITPDTTLAELVDAWLNDLRIERRLETTTINEYERVLRKLVVPTLGGHRLAALRTDGIDAVLADLGTQSVNRQREAKVVTGAMLDASVALGASASNPVRGSMPVRRPKSEPRALSPAEVERIRTAVRACTAKIVPVRSRRATSPTSFSSCSAPGPGSAKCLHCAGATSTWKPAPSRSTARSRPRPRRGPTGNRSRRHAQWA